jgi:hypothetical protein
MGFKPPLSRGIIKKFFLISSWVPFKAESIQNPKSKIEMTEFSPLNKGGWGGSKGLKTCPRVI